MNTRILLHGGNADNGREKNARFFADILSGVDNNTVKVLCIYFARPEGRWEASYSADQSSFRAQAIVLGKDVDTVLATYDMYELLEQISESDVIFINGGFKGHLKDTLLAIGAKRFTQMVEGKTLVGISAGANMLSKYYYSMAIDGIREGIGMINAKLLTHSNHENTPERIKQLKAHREDLPIIAVAEEEYVEL